MKRAESGFTLVELLVVITILGFVTFVLANSMIVGLKATNSTVNRVSGTSAAETLNSYFFGDVASATTADTNNTSSTPGTTCGTVAGTFLHLNWTETDTAPAIESKITDVFYAFDPPTGSEQNLVRVTCTTTVAASNTTNTGQITTILGHFSGVSSVWTPPPGSEPVQVACGVASAPCADALDITLVVRSDPAAPTADLSAFRRS